MLMKINVITQIEKVFFKVDLKTHTCVFIVYLCVVGEAFNHNYCIGKFCFNMAVINQYSAFK